MKKQYITPRAELMRVWHETMIAVSEIGTGDDLDKIDAESREFFNDEDEDFEW